MTKNELVSSLYRVIDELHSSYDFRQDEWHRLWKLDRDATARYNASMTGRKIMPKSEWEEIESACLRAGNDFDNIATINTIANNRLNSAIEHLAFLGHPYSLSAAKMIA